MSGISNHEIISFFSKEENEDIPKNCWCNSFQFHQSFYYLSFYYERK